MAFKNFDPIKTRTIYHSHLKVLARENLLPSTILSRIPRGNLSRWRKEQREKYELYDVNISAHQDLELIRAFAKNQSARKVFSAYVRVALTLKTLIQPLHEFKRIVKDNRLVIVTLIDRTRSIIGLQKLLKVFNISLPTFRNWQMQTHTSCFQSITASCNKIFPNQLSRPQIQKMKAILQDYRFTYWPVSSIAWYSLRNNLLPLS